MSLLYSHIILTSFCITVIIVIIVMVINRHDKISHPYIINFLYSFFSPSNFWLHTTGELPGAPPTIAAALSAAAPAPPPSAPSASPPRSRIHSSGHQAGSFCRGLASALSTVGGHRLASHAVHYCIRKLLVLLRD